MVNISLHKLAWDLIDFSPYSDGLSISYDTIELDSFKKYLKEFTGFKFDGTDDEKYKILVTQVLLPILNAFPELESEIHKDWDNKTYLKSGIPFIKYDAVKNIIDELLSNISKNQKLIKLIYESDYLMRFKLENNKLKKLAIFLIILINASPINLVK